VKSHERCNVVRKNPILPTLRPPSSRALNLSLLLILLDLLDDGRLDSSPSELLGLGERSECAVG